VFDEDGATSLMVGDRFDDDVRPAGDHGGA